MFRSPTAFLGSDLVALLPAIRECLLRSLNPANRDFSVRTIDLSKEATNLFDPSFTSPSAVHAGVGVQRQLARDVALSADLVWREFRHTLLSGIDYNRVGSNGGAVIPLCSAAQRNDVHATCSNGPIAFDNSDGRARYVGLLVRLDKRLSARSQLLAAYALGRYSGTNGTGAGTGFSNDDRTRNDGPLPNDGRHTLNVSGTFDLPAGMQIAVNASAASALPFSAYVAGIDFDGDGTTGDLLPGTTVNQFRGSSGKDELVQLIATYNQQRAHRTTAGGQIAPFLTLPATFSFNDGLFSVDVRVARAFAVRVVRAQIFGEVFNLLNTANLVGYDGNLAGAAFGQPASRFTQVFGSGGPRAAQVGAKLTF